MSPNTTPMLPSVSPRNPALERASALPLTGVSPPMGALTLSAMEVEMGSRPAPDTAPGAPHARLRLYTLRAPESWAAVALTGVFASVPAIPEIGRNRRRFPHRRNGNAAIGGHIRIVGEQRVTDGTFDGDRGRCKNDNVLTP